MTSSAPTTRPLFDWEGFLYRNTGTYGSPTLTPMLNVKGVEAPDKLDEDDVTVRGAAGRKQTIGTLQDQELNFSMLNISGDADVAAIRTAYAARTPIEFFMTDYVVTDSAAVGFRCVMQVMECTLMQADGKTQYWQVKCKPTYTTAAQVALPIVGGSTWILAT